MPLAVAAAVIDFLTTVLVPNPHRVGKPLLNGPRNRPARWGAYRVVCLMCRTPVVGLG